MKNYWLKSGFFTLLERGTVLVFGFGGLLLLLRQFSLEEFGTWAVFLSIVSIVEVGRIGLLSNALVKYLSNRIGSPEEGILNTASLVLNVLLTTIIVAVLYFGAPTIARIMEQPVLIDMLRLYCVTTVLLVPFFQFNFIQQANLDFSGITFSNIVKQGTLFTVIAMGFFFSRIELTLISLAQVQVLGAVLATLVSFGFARRFLNFSWQIRWTWVGELFRFGKYVCGTNLSTMLYKSIDRLMLGALPGVGMAAVGIYDTAMRVTNMVEVPTFSMANMLFPQSSRRAGEGPRALRDLYEKATGAIMALLLPAIAGVMVLAPWIIDVVAGDTYAAAAPVLRVTILFGLFIPFIVQFGTVVDSMGKPKVNFGFTLASMLINIVLNYLFITRYGVMGAAWGTVLTYAITFTAMQLLLYRMLGVKFWRAFGYIPQFYAKGWQTVQSKIFKKPPSEVLDTPMLPAAPGSVKSSPIQPSKK